MLKLCGIGIGLVLTMAALAIHAQTSTRNTTGDGVWTDPQNITTPIVVGGGAPPLLCPEYSDANGKFKCVTEGNPPRFVGMGFLPCNNPADDPDCMRVLPSPTGNGWIPAKEVPAHWECDKGYRLDGFTVEWSDAGIAEIKPLRCIK